MVLGVDPQPYAGVAQPVGHRHPQHVAVEGQVLADRAGEVVDVPEPPRPADVDGRGRAGVLRPAVRLAPGLAVRE